MATQTIISEADYLAAHFEDPIPEYVCGELVERTMPNNPHSRVVGELHFRFRLERDRLLLFPRGELCVRVASGNYRVVDLVVYAGQEPQDVIPRQVPLACIEVVSPDDRYEDIMSKLADYEDWGVPNVWLVDPGLRRLAVYSKGSLTAVPAFELPNLRIEANDILG